MKVLFIASWWPTSVFPAHGNFVYKHARTVAKRHDVIVVTVQADNTLGGGRTEIAERFTDNFTEIVVYFGKRSDTVWSKAYSRVRSYYVGIQRALKVFGVHPDLTHAHVAFDAGIVAWILSIVMNIPFVVTEHSTRYLQRRPMNPIRRFLLKLTFQRASAVLPVSRYLAESMQQLHGIRGKFRVVSNVVDESVFCPLEHRRPTSRFRLLHVSTLKDDQKNVTGMLRAFALVAQQHPGKFHLQVVGEGDIVPAQRYSRALGIDRSAITITGRSPEVAIAAFMQQSDALIQFSHYETQGVVVLEALCSGLPCVVSDIPPLNDIVRPGHNGLLVEAGDVASLSEAIIQVSTSMETFDRRDIAQRARARFGEQAVGNAISGVYQRAVW